MLRNFFLAVILAGTSFSSLANWDWEGGLSTIKLSKDNRYSSIGGVTASLGYRVDLGSMFSIVPEVRLGRGMTNTHIIPLNKFVSFSVRGQASLNDLLYVFAAPYYTKSDLTSTSIHEENWETGLGGGIGLNLKESAAIELMLEEYDGSEAISFGLRLRF